MEEADRARVGILETKRVQSARVPRTRAGAWTVLPRLAILRRMAEGRAGRGMREAARRETREIGEEVVEGGANEEER